MKKPVNKIKKLDVEDQPVMVTDPAQKDPFLANIAKLARKNNKIPSELYVHYNVKRGLRNADGTGVLVGLTEIGNVHGYVVSDGEKVPSQGKLSYRGVNVGDIVKGCLKDKRHGYEETAYLLLFGELPNAEQYEQFKKLLAKNRPLPEGFTQSMILEAPSANIMNKLSRCVLSCYSFDKTPEDRSLKNILRQCIGLIARMPTMAAYAYQAKSHYHDNQSLFIHRPLPELSTAENLLRLIRPDASFTKTEADLLDLCMILHAEHGGGNNSSFTTHVVSSSDTDTYSAIAAAIGSLKGLKHGGANIAVVNMMENIKENVENYENQGQVADYLAKIVQKKAYDKTGLIYGVGHAVYTLSDPRATLLKSQAAELAKEKGLEWEFNLYDMVEDLAPEVFQKVKKSDKVVSINVDFYSGFVYRMLGIPSELYTPIFAIARMSGWASHIIEERVSGGRIIRPAYKNIVEPKKYSNLNDR